MHRTDFIECARAASNEQHKLGFDDHLERARAGGMRERLIRIANRFELEVLSDEKLGSNLPARGMSCTAAAAPCLDAGERIGIVRQKAMHSARPRGTCKSGSAHM